MALETSASISNALSQTFQGDIARQWNRMAVSAALIPAQAGMGKNAAWEVEFTGATAATVGEGADVQAAEFASDANVPATQGWAHYRSSFQVTETELDAAASSIGIPQALQDIFGERILGNAAKLCSQINKDICAGTGADANANTTIVGFTGGACDSTGIYGGISRTLYTEWAGNPLANGGNARPLTFDLLSTADQNIFANSGRDFDYIITTPGVLRKYEGLFTSIQRQSVDNGGQAALTMGDGAQAKGVFTGLFYKGRPVYRDKDMTTGAALFGCLDCFGVKFLPRLQANVDTPLQRMQNAIGFNGDKVTTVTTIPVRIAVLAKTGDSIKVSLKTSLAMINRRPNASALIKDISEV